MRHSFINVLITLVMAMVFIMAIACVGVCAVSVKNASGYVNTPDDELNVRKSAKENAKVVCTLPDNTKLTIKSVAFESKTSTSSSKKWYKVSAKLGTDTVTGYVNAKYVDGIKYTNVDAKVTAKATYRKGAGTKMKKVGTLKKGTKVKVLLKATPVSGTAGSSKTWYLIKYNDKKYYACSKYFKLIESSDQDDQAAEEAKKKAEEEAKKAEEEAKKKAEEEAKKKAEEEAAAKIKVTVSNLTYPSASTPHTEGKSFGLSGTITTSEKMTNIDIGITDTEGNWVIKVSKQPKSKTFNVSSVDNDIRFGTLGEGTYKYVANVQVSGITKEAFSHTFTVASTVKKTLTDKIVMARIQEILDALDVHYFTSNQEKCTSSTGATCNVDKVLKENSVVRDLLEKNKGGKDLKPSLLPQHYGVTGGTLTRGYSCCGFANFAAWYIAADTINDDIGYRAVKVKCKYDEATIQQYARVGDVLRGSDQSSTDEIGHSFMIVSIEDDGCVVMDSNWGYTCLVSTHKLKWNYFSVVTISRAVNRADS